MLELSPDLSIRTFRLEARSTAARLRAVPETAALARDFDEAHDRLALLEAEGADMDLRRVEAEARVETADDAWDDAMHAFQRQLLDLVEGDVDAELYRDYFADIPSQVTSLSYAAEALISRDLEERLAVAPRPELVRFAERLRERREALEAALHGRTRLEVEEARFHNRVALGKAVVNKLRRVLFAHLEEIARTRGHGASWPARFFHGRRVPVVTVALDGPTRLGREVPKELPEGDLGDDVDVDARLEA